MLAGGQGLRSRKAGPLEIEQVVGVHRLAVHQIHRPSVKTSPLANDHAFGPALRDVDVGGNGERSVHNTRLVAVRDTDGGPRIVEDLSTRSLVRTRRDEPR